MAMVSFRLLSILCLFFILISQTKAQSPNYLGHFCSNHSGNYTANSPYENNLMTLLTSVSTNTEIDYGFYNFSYGQNSDKVNAIGLCRADLNVDDCLGCLNISRILLTQKCPNQKEAIVYYDICMLRYSNRSIFGIKEDEPTFSLSNPNNVTDGEVAQFNQVLGNLMHNLTSIASSGDSRRKVSGRSVSAGSQTIFGLVQCTPDLSQVDCETCLLGAISQNIPSCCKDKIGGRIHRPSCTARFEIFSFYNAILDVPDVSPPPPSTNNTEGNNTSRIIIATVVPIVAISLMLVFIRIYSKIRKSKKNNEDMKEWVNYNTELKKDKSYIAEDEIANSESLQFHFDTIKAATDNFSDANKLGQGGFGAVYKGRLTNGQEVAVKRLSINSGQGETEFKNEVLLVAKLQHRNLVRLLGFCLEGRERLLIYEFVQNKSLDYYIFGVHVDPSKHSQLNCETRYKIIRGIARGILYLHEDSRLRIIHRDLKASNILLDEEMNAKISDFGMARLVVMDQTQVNTSKIVGTYGYMAPESALLGQFSMKSDVFSFGVLVLEIVSSHRNNGICQGEYKEHLASFTWKHWKEGRVENIIDPTLNNDSRNEMLRCIHIGLLCVQENIVDRPTMSTVVLMLNSPALTLPIPSAPAFLIDGKKFSNIALWEFNSMATGTSESKNKSFQESINDVLVTELYPR